MMNEFLKLIIELKKKKKNERYFMSVIKTQLLPRNEKRGRARNPGRVMINWNNLSLKINSKIEVVDMKWPDDAQKALLNN